MKHHDLPGANSIMKSCLELGVVPPDDFPGKLKVFLDLLNECSGRMNLVGPDEGTRLWKRHVLESVCYAAHLDAGSVVDVGTGAGFPGFVLALLGYSVTMVDPREKRCGFLETAARECGITARVIRARIEEEGPFGFGTRFTARAVKKPEELLRLLERAAPEGFTLLTRVPDAVGAYVGNCVFHRLPAPPLDREGFLLQYSHSDNHE